MASPLRSSQEQHITLSQHLDAVVVEVGSFNNGDDDGAPAPSVVGGDNGSTTISKADRWRKILKMVYLAINIAGIFKAQKRITTAEGREGEGKSSNSQNDFESSRDVGEEPPVTPLRTVPQAEKPDDSNTSVPPSHNDSDVRSTRNSSRSANSASTPNLPFSLPSAPVYQTDCTFSPTICALSSNGSTDAASMANPIYQIGCNVAPNIHPPSSYMMNPIYQIGCNFTPNMSVPPSHSSANTASESNSLFYPPATPTAYQIGCRFAPTIFASSSYNSVNVESTAIASDPARPDFECSGSGSSDRQPAEAQT
ncbi:hypothetical protein EDD85DRAFT_118475 [Armillaria nabsnona]|nr:hypothetical protein EDD85DRAFT_118475 [Armillaria nabsnona]